MTSPTTVILSDGVMRYPTALAELRNKIGGFSAIQIISFGRLMLPLYDVAADLDKFVRDAEQGLRRATTAQDDIYEKLAEVNYLGVAYSELHSEDDESGIDGTWYLEHYLMPRIGAVNQSVKLFIWHEDGDYWE